MSPCSNWPDPNKASMFLSVPLSKSITSVSTLVGFVIFCAWTRPSGTDLGSSGGLFVVVVLGLSSFW